MKLALVILLAIIAFAIILPLLHLVATVLLVVGGVIVLMAAWKVLFGPLAATQGRGGPPAIS